MTSTTSISQIPSDYMDITTALRAELVQTCKAGERVPAFILAFDHVLVQNR
jgi:hypothetical protein